MRRLLVCLVTLSTAAGACSSEPSDVDVADAAATTAPPVAPATTAPPTPTTAPATAAPTSTEPPAPTDPLLVATDLGPVRGAASAIESVRAFQAIPYAEPPVGDLRWAAPVTRTSWADELDATSPGASCPQPGDGLTAQFLVTPDWDDDCLSLSVWTPDDAAGLPVMVWIHGGGLSTGSAHEPYYIGDELAARGVVVVDINYRLGALGFLGGNWGLLDQVEALDWVQRNIAGFGGDPDRVTIFGESAGGFSVCGHLAAMNPGVFHQAIIQSGGGCGRLQAGDTAEAAVGSVIEAAGCADLDCLRAVPTDELLEIPFNPVLIDDDAVLSTTALDLAVNGDLATIPIITGFNADESTLFTLTLEDPTDEQFRNLAANAEGDPEEVLALYPADEFDDSLDRYRALSTDLSFGCPAIRFAASTPNTFAYLFDYVSANTPFDLGATHGAELAYLFGHPEGLTILEPDFDPVDQAVSDGIQQAWVDFATTGSPGWDAYDLDNGGGVMVIGETFEFVDTVRNGRCEAQL